MALGGFLQVGIDILKTVVSAKTKTILVQIGDALTEEREADSLEWWQHIGFISRPSKPQPGKSAAQGVLIRQSGTDAIIASRDLRGQALAGDLKDGETCIYAPGEFGEAQARMLLKADGTATLFTRVGNVEGAAGIAVSLDAKNDQITIVNSKGYGIIISPDGVTLTASGSSLALGADGNVELVATGDTVIDGTSVTLGPSLAAAPGLNSALIGPSGIAGRPSTKVFIGS